MLVVECMCLRQELQVESRTKDDSYWRAVQTVYAAAALQSRTGHRNCAAGTYRLQMYLDTLLPLPSVKVGRRRANQRTPRYRSLLPLP